MTYPYNEQEGVLRCVWEKRKRKERMGVDTNSEREVQKVESEALRCAI